MKKIVFILFIASSIALAQQARIGIHADYANVFGFNPSTEVSSGGISLSIGFRTKSFGLDFKPGYMIGSYFTGFDYELMSKYYLLSRTSYFALSLNVHENMSGGGHTVTSSGLSFVMIGIGYGLEHNDNYSLNVIVFYAPGNNNIGSSRGGGYNEHGVFTYSSTEYVADVILEISAGFDIIFGNRF